MKNRYNIYSDPTNMQNEMELLEPKLKHEEEMYTKSKREMEQKMRVVIKNLS